MYFLIFQPKDVLIKLCLNFNKSQPIYAYKHYAYKKEYITTNLVLSLNIARKCHEYYGATTVIAPFHS